MKGIKKLFFGLIFMTLVGVGFKVDVKAGVSFVEPDFSEENTEKTVMMLYATKDMFPEVGKLRFQQKKAISMKSLSELKEQILFMPSFAQAVILLQVINIQNR